MNDELPQGWAVASLAQLTTNPKQDIVSGPFGSNLKSNEYVSEGVPIIRVQNVDRNRFLEKNMRFITRQKARELSAHKFQAGDVVITKLGDPLGKACIVPESISHGIVVADVVRVRIDENRFCKPYAVLAINSPAVVNQINLEMMGSTRPRVNLNHLRDLEIPLAPLAEQRRIVAKLETLLGKVDACQQRLAKIPVLLKHFRQSVLDAACSGRLTADWRKENGGDHCESTTVEAIADYVGGFAYKSPTFLETGRHQVIRIGNVRPFALKLDASPVFIPDYIAEQTQRFKVLPGDIVISMTGTKYKRDYGCAALVTDSDGGLFLNQRVARVRCGDSVLPKFLMFWFQTDLFREFFFSGETGNVNQGNVGAGGIRNAPIELPPLAEQQEIVRRVEALFALADQIEARFQTAKLQVSALTPSLLARAFRGQLVPQDPTDEPAEKLLERINHNT